jgi:hypothetical protein
VLGFRHHMSTQDPAKPLPPGGDHGKPPASQPAAAEVVSPAGDDQAPAKELTPEEQMALFEKDLKEKDWGHQPC